MNNIIALSVILGILLVYFGLGKRGIWSAAKTADNVKLWSGAPDLGAWLTQPSKPNPYPNGQLPDGSRIIPTPWGGLIVPGTQGNVNA